MAALGWQLAAEGRKAVHPLPIGFACASIAVVCALQWNNAEAPYPGPSISDLNGCMRIAALQYATTLGFVVCGATAAGTANDVSSGALADSLLREPRRHRVALLKIAVTFAATVAVSVVGAGALWLTSVARRRSGIAFAPNTQSQAGATVIDVASSLLVMLFIATLAVIIAFATRSALLTIILTPAVFVLPLSILQDNFLWLWPTRWIVEFLHLDPFGKGIDYLAVDSAYDQRGLPALIGGIALATSAICLALLTGRSMDYAITHSVEAP